MLKHVPNKKQKNFPYCINETTEFKDEEEKKEEKSVSKSVNHIKMSDFHGEEDNEKESINKYGNFVQKMNPMITNMIYKTPKKK